MKNQVQLITYADRLSGGDLKDLHRLLTGPLKGAFGGVHILPFFYPIDGSDAGFDPINHSQVDPRLGTWDDLITLSGEVEIVADLIVNHISSESPQFLDYSQNGDTSPYKDLFLKMDSVFPQGATEEELLKIYRPRPGLPFTYAILKNGTKRLLWTTFTSRQLDIDVRHPLGEAYLKSILQTFQQYGIRVIRLDAVGYAIKKPGTSCFMIPETFEFIEELTQYARTLGIEVLVEIHSYYRQQIEIAHRVDRVYDFALPPLVLHAFFKRTARYLKNWLEISPRNAVTVLDTHDGIGIIDAGPEGDLPGLLPLEDLNMLVDTIHRNSNGQSAQATGGKVYNLDLYQVNCSFFDAMGRIEGDYWLARAIQFFSPGIPQVYYVGLLAGENDMELLAQTRSGRDINRHFYKPEEVATALQKPPVQKLIRLMKFRNQHPAFQGDFSMPSANDETLVLHWENGSDWAQLVVDFPVGHYELTHSGPASWDIYES